ncbi:restriction endonuclease subunit S [Geobacillus stearothermophilus]|uniref:restriction endonuclease subunit S n=1 Tax=Geobacillus stearothermophilus TaxID=1422 RepID=UPI003D1C6090
MSKPERKQVPHPLKSIPNDWDFEQLGKLIEFKNGYAFNSCNYTEEGKIILRMSNISKEGKLQFREDNIKYCSEEEYNHLESFHLKKGDLVICMTDVTPEKAIIGRTAVVDADNKYILNQRVGRIRITEGERILGSFLHYFTNFELYLKFMRERCSGSAQFNLSTSEIKSVYVPLPPIAEQRKIAAILSSVDEAIEKTEAIIEQTEKVKKGLMQQLLTKGIGHTKFKKTEIGEIPEEWEVRSIDEIAFVNPEALSNKTDNNYEFEYIDISSIEKPGKIGKTARYKFKDAPSRARRLVRTGDTIVSTVRPYLKGFAFIDKEHDGRVCSTGFAVLRPKASIDPLFLFQSILLNNFVEFLKSRMTGSNYPAVTASDIKEYKFGVPTDINEQKEIAKILSIYDRKLGVEEATLIQLTNLKKSLMQSLLTGKVRVKVDDEVVSS